MTTLTRPGSDPAHCPDSAPAAELVRRYGLTAADLVVEVGSGAGGFLRAVRKLGPRVLGVEPHLWTLLKSYRGGLPGVSAEFDRAAAGYVLTSYGPAAVLIVRGPAADAPGVRELAAGCITPNGVVLRGRADGRFEEWRAARAA